MPTVSGNWRRRGNTCATGRLLGRPSPACRFELPLCLPHNHILHLPPLLVLLSPPLVAVFSFLLSLLLFFFLSFIYIIGSHSSGKSIVIVILLLLPPLLLCLSLSFLSFITTSLICYSVVPSVNVWIAY